jgi:hypothetical protein
MKDVKGFETDPTSSLIAEDIAVIGTFTADTTDHVLTGPWTYIRAVKLGTTGYAKVQGFV